MTYRLKKGQEAFEVVDGAFAGRKYERDREYAENQVPAQERHRFEKVAEAKAEPAPAEKKSAKGGDQ